MRLVVFFIRREWPECSVDLRKWDGNPCRAGCCFKRIFSLRPLGEALAAGVPAGWIRRLRKMWFLFILVPRLKCVIAQLSQEYVCEIAVFARGEAPWRSPTWIVPETSPVRVIEGDCHVGLHMQASPDRVRGRLSQRQELADSFKCCMTRWLSLVQHRALERERRDFSPTVRDQND